MVMGMVMVILIFGIILRRELEMISDNYVHIRIPLINSVFVVILTTLNPKIGSIHAITTLVGIGTQSLPIPFLITNLVNRWLNPNLPNLGQNQQNHHNFQNLPNLTFPTFFLPITNNLVNSLPNVSIEHLGLGLGVVDVSRLVLIIRRGRVIYYIYYHNPSLTKSILGPKPTPNHISLKATHKKLIGKRVPDVVVRDQGLDRLNQVVNKAGMVMLEVGIQPSPITIHKPVITLANVVQIPHAMVMVILTVEVVAVVVIVIISMVMVTIIKTITITTTTIQIPTQNTPISSLVTSTVMKALFTAELATDQKNQDAPGGQEVRAMVKTTKV